jgi:3-hydroxyisobutyrate dehydrogenase-like beta-hydroxyacid dehydrogenase
MRLMRQGALRIDMSSSAPLRRQALAARLDAAGQRFLDVPAAAPLRRRVSRTAWSRSA